MISLALRKWRSCKNATSAVTAMMTAEITDASAASQPESRAVMCARSRPPGCGPSRPEGWGMAELARLLDDVRPLIVDARQQGERPRFLLLDREAYDAVAACKRTDRDRG